MPRDPRVPNMPGFARWSDARDVGRSSQSPSAQTARARSAVRPCTRARSVSRSIQAPSTSAARRFPCASARKTARTRAPYSRRGSRWSERPGRRRPRRTQARAPRRRSTTSSSSELDRTMADVDSSTRDPYVVDGTGVREPPVGWRQPSLPRAGPDPERVDRGLRRTHRHDHGRRPDGLRAPLAGPVQLPREGRHPDRVRAMDHHHRHARACRLRSRPAAHRPHRLDQPALRRHGALEGAAVVGHHRRHGHRRSASCCRSDPIRLLDPSRTIWHVIVVAATIGALYAHGYRSSRRAPSGWSSPSPLVTMAIAFGLPWSPWSYSLADLLGGLTFHLPAAALGSAIAMFGITGVGADEITAYNYWCLEKGYARWTGPNDGSEAWVRRARGWIPRDVQGRGALDGGLHVCHHRLLHHGRGRPAPAATGAARQRDDHDPGADVHRRARPVGDDAVPGRRDRGARIHAVGGHSRCTRGCTRTSSPPLAFCAGENAAVRTTWIRRFTVALPHRVGRRVARRCRSRCS